MKKMMTMMFLAMAIMIAAAIPSYAMQTTTTPIGYNAMNTGSFGTYADSTGARLAVTNPATINQSWGGAMCVVYSYITNVCIK